MHTNPISSAGVMIFLLWREKFLLILRDNKPEISLPNTWSAVTGGVEIGETFFEAIQRELDEEIGFIPSDIQTLGVSAKGNCFFFGRLTDEEKEQIILGEGQKYDFFSYEDIPESAKGAFRIYLDRYPEVFWRMCEDPHFTPNHSDLNLAHWDKPPAQPE
jgi:ADP-ribose pyrophosphatase YjhB (NUDIX family)